MISSVYLCHPMICVSVCAVTVQMSQYWRREAGIVRWICVQLISPLKETNSTPPSLCHLWGRTHKLISETRLPFSLGYILFCSLDSLFYKALDILTKHSG